MAKPNSVDWVSIKTEYVTRRCSYRELSEKYGVSVTQISNVSRREHWAELRKEHQAECVALASEKAADKEADRLARLVTATTKAIDVAMEALEDDRQFNRYIVTDSIGDGATETTEQVFEKVDTKALKNLTGVLKDLTGLMREYYNIPTPAQRIAAEKLELEKKKAGSSGGSKDVTVTVKLENAAEYGK